MATGTSAVAQIKLKPGAIAGKEVHNAKARNFAYCEIAPVLKVPELAIGKPGEAVAQFYNSAPGDHCPVDKMAAIDAQKLTAEVGADFVYMNPTPQARRHWVMDELWIFKAGESVDFHGVQATWVASMSPELMKGMIRGPYLYSSGNKVFLMRAPEGKTWVMQSYARRSTRTSVSSSSLSWAASSSFRPEVVTLTKDLTIDPRRANGVAHIVRDDLHNVYEGCGFDATCDYVP